MTIDTTKLRYMLDRMPSKTLILSEITAHSLFDEIDRLRTIESAARNLAKAKGRHHSELAMNQLLEALG